MKAYAESVGNDSAEWKEELDSRLKDLTESLEVAGDFLIKLIKKRPYVCLMSAAVLGYVIGRLVRR